MFKGQISEEEFVRLYAKFGAKKLALMLGKETSTIYRNRRRIEKELDIEIVDPNAISGRRAGVTEKEFINLFKEIGTAGLVKHLGVSLASIRQRRQRIEKRAGITLVSPYAQGGKLKMTKGRIEIPDFADGIIMIGSDAHYWPGEGSTAHRAFVSFCAKYDPGIVVMNGDAIDAACISRFPPLGWEDMPSVAEELDVCKVRLHEITGASPNSSHIWTLGNHDARFETRLASVAPEFKHVHGVHLKDHFPDWENCWSLFIGDQHGVVIKHRFKGGIHAPHNNVMWAGRSVITGHLHSQKVTPFTDYNGTRWGVDGGCLADPNGPQFVGYSEDNPHNWRAGFCMLTFNNGVLLPPELITVVEPGVVVFRGELTDV